MKAKGGQKRPIKKTLTNVHNAWMEDVTFPFPISGKRIKYTKDGK